MSTSTTQAPDSAAPATPAADETLDLEGVGDWQPSVTPGIGRDLTSRQELACAFRILAAGGFSENLAGHITWAVPDSGNLLINPWGLWWQEVTASDICEVAPDGAVVAGRWDVTPAYHIHTQLHLRRPEARVVVHNHPYYCTVLAAIGLLPEILHQTGSMFDGDLGFVDEYTGEIDTADLGSDLDDKIGDKDVTILANHGVIVTAPTLEEAIYRSASFDRQCRLMVDVLKIGRPFNTVEPSLRPAMRAALIQRGPEIYWNGEVRMLLAREPEVLD
jgi:ribulose-5-phosphate 4-epimerase/fuculose-1-phosphate aldolase